MDDYQNIQQLWTSLKTNREQYVPLWDDIEKYTGIMVNPDYAWNNNTSNKSTQLDEFVDDPTSAISVNQFGDYLIGIIWGTGANAFNIIPSRYVLEETNKEIVEDWYSFITDQTLYHMNHTDAGLQTSLKPYAYDQASFGTSGVGVFPNQGFVNRTDDNAMVFRNYGIDNLAIDEGKSGQVDYVFVTYHWRVNRIIGEFCMEGGKIKTAKYAKMPKRIKDAHEKGDFNQEFNIVFGTFPRHDFDPKLRGARGTRYRGVWFLDDATDNNIFHEESFAERPIAVCRQIKVRGEVYGRSSGTLLISSIRSVNFMMGTTIEIIEKMSNPSLGMFNNAIFGDSVLDTSSNGLTIFNAALAGAQNSPLFPIHDVGDPSGIIQFLIPYLNDKITTAFKVDALLDFNSAKDMTATESLQRYAIRGKSLAGLLQQQKNELLEPICKRAISILMTFGELGVDPTTDRARADALEKRGKPERVIPDAVLQVMKSGRPWYELKFNNEMEKLTRTESVQNLLQIINAIGAVASMYPDIIEAVDWYKLLSDINDNLDYNNQILSGPDEFKQKIAAIAQVKAQAMALQAAQVAGQVQKDGAQANKANQEAANVRTK